MELSGSYGRVRVIALVCVVVAMLAVIGLVRPLKLVPKANACGPTPTPPPAGTFPLHVSGRIVQTASNNPFLIVGDGSAQFLINIPLTGANSMDTYFTARQNQKFNSYWVNAPCTAAYGCPNSQTFDGIQPFTGTLAGCGGSIPQCWDLSTPNSTYWTRIDNIINKAATYGGLVFFDPASTDGCVPTGFMTTMINNGTTKVNGYGTFIGNRYKTFPNIIWQNGNDFQCIQTTSDVNLVVGLVNAIKATGDTHIQTAEANFLRSTTFDWSLLSPPMNMNAAYTYLPTYDWVRHGYNQVADPVYMVEANYENSNNNNIEPPGPVALQTLRKQMWWSMTQGAAGQLYGNKLVLQNSVAGWQNNLSSPGAGYETFVANFFNAFDWQNLAPDLTNVVLTAGQGTYTNGTLSDPLATNNYATCAYADSALNTTAVVYAPTTINRALTINMAKFGGTALAKWFDPTNGAFTTIGNFANSGSHVFTTPGNNAAGDPDWVLFIQGPHL